jgi:hypothetical protein
VLPLDARRLVVVLQTLHEVQYIQISLDGIANMHSQVGLTRNVWQGNPTTLGA